MLFLFHGGNVGQSRRSLLRLKSRYKMVDVLPVETASDFEKFVGVCESRGMFSSVRLVVVEGRRKVLDQRRLTEYLAQKPKTTHVAFWFGENLGQNSSLLNFVRSVGGKVIYFRGVSKSIFPFLDALGSKEKKKAFLELYSLLAAGENPLALFSRVSYQFREVLKAKYQLPQPGLHPFVRRKLRSQAANFSLSELLKIYKRLLAFEKDIKMGRKEALMVLPRLVDGITESFLAESGGD